MALKPLQPIEAQCPRCMAPPGERCVAEDGTRQLERPHVERFNLPAQVSHRIGQLNPNEHRIIIAALETYRSIWAAAVTEARKDGDPIDERLAQGRYDEAGELLAKFKGDPEGASPAEMVGKLDANVAAEQARDREHTRSRRAPYGLAELEQVDQQPSLLSSFGGAAQASRDFDAALSGRVWLENFDHNLDDLR